ncbi:MAG: carbon-nitrogen hydrolase family protein [Spirochaetales bacterium]
MWRRDRPAAVAVLAALAMLVAPTALTALPAPDELAGDRSADGGRPPDCGANPPDTVTITTVQYEVRRETYLSVDRFRREMEAIVRHAALQHDADLVVFPEYVNVFLIAAVYPSIAVEATDVNAAVRLIAAQANIEPNIKEILRAHAAEIAAAASGVWTDLAEQYDVSIVAGTVFALARAGDSELRNRLLVVDDDGRVVYTQDKAYLTAEEERLLGLSPAPVSEAELVAIEGLDVGITICRDTYFGAWETVFQGIDLWIDLRANGEPYTREVYERFLKTLPERVRESDAVAGVNASLTGEFLGFLWEGPSYAVDATGRRVACSNDPRGTELTTVDLVRTNGSWTIRPTAVQNR